MNDKNTMLNKIEYYIYRTIEILQQQCFLLYYKIKFSDINFNGMKLYGFPYFRFLGKTTLGNNLVFNSKEKHYYLGLNHPCIIDVKENAHLEIGDNCGFSAVSIRCWNSISIGKHVLFGFNVTVSDTDSHPVNYLERRVSVIGAENAPVVIGDDVWIGGNSIILKGVHIGARSIIGAGSVVTKNIPLDEIWAGNPARFIKKIENHPK
ncbi:hypothetical protein FACS189451_02930 [Bacteroidia bacterium]|nr:hypothetical protein FACS189451_02930 [Bacteroidia bacterium]